ncbi:hypothetical protein AB0I10_40215 [Streptomyces sp. NPDC050636]|uniref:hypothetical protein n=1 Tax=Streptomyces sp. NPDC050636 TaxID=3154510 RepID=UPI0034343460
MKKRSGSYPPVRVVGGGRSVVSQAAAVLLVETVRKSGLDGAISAALAPWRKPRAVHNRARSCWMTRSRLIGALAATDPKALTAIRSARAEVRARIWELAAADAPDADGQVIVDIDGVLVLSHSEKQDATVLKIPMRAWTPAYDAGGTERSGARGVPNPG